MSEAKCTAIQEFLWRCAAVDQETMLDARCPAVDRIKYALTGALVCTTSVVAGVGWTYEFYLIFLGNDYRLPLALTLGPGMGILMFLCEQLLIASIPARITTLGRLTAYSWRLLLAVFSASLMALPVMLGYFQNEIIGHLDDKKLAQMAEKRKAVDNVFGLSTLGVSIEDTDKAINKNAEAHDTLPLYITDLGNQTATCDRENRRLRAAVVPRLEAAIGQRKDIKLQLDSEQELASLTAKARLAELSSHIARWSRTLALKAQACSSMAQQLTSAKQKYYADLEAERTALQKRKAEQQDALTAAQREAKPVLKQSDDAVRKRTMPDLSARAQALYELAMANPFIKAICLAFFGFFLWVDSLPITAKLTSRSIYERLLAARESSTIVELDTDVAIAQARAEIRKAEAMAEMVGSQRFYAEMAGESFRDAAAAQNRQKRDKIEVLDSFEQVIAVVDAFDKANAAVDDLAKRYATNPAAAAELEPMRGMLQAAMRRAGRILGMRFEAGYA